ncbi:hypothetical protein L486_02401 [Kwoniella mangroviensis CBS 10435]|uniref:Uncharacterized protein n=1 Tax=Kwoniella mangroviensis CBS 10435 TaxID=1331196 RepID=A0A1B9IW14_9TREE|nr:hypothetical protein L486_02401 [Kwoniella mangroviensis CBS 10435]
MDNNNNWPWNIVNRYCQDPTQRAWVSNQLHQSPIPPGQSPEDWLLARSMVAEGMTEAEAWAQVHLSRQNQQQNNGNTNHTNMFVQQPTVFKNGSPYQGHQQQFFDQANHLSTNSPYGYVSLQDVAPQVQQQQQPQPRSQNPLTLLQQIPGITLPPQILNMSPEQQMTVYRLFREQQDRARNAAHRAGPASISPQLLQQPPRPQQAQHNTLQGQSQLQQPEARPQAQPRPQPLARPLVTIDLTQDGSPRDESPIRLIPPGSPRTPSPMTYHTLSIQPAPSRKRSLVPIPAQESSDKMVKRIRPNSSSLEKPIKIDNNNLLNEPILKASGSTSANASAAEPITIKTIRPYLTPDALKLPKPAQLFKHIRKRENNKGEILPPLFLPSPKEVLEIVSALRDHASPEYLRAMADDERYCDVWSSWLLKSIKDIEKWEVAIVPVLQVLAKTDMPIDEIEDTKIRIRARKLVNLANEKNLASRSAIQSAFQRYDSYVANVLIPQGRRSAPDDDEDDDSNNKKRKIDQVSKDDIKLKIEPGTSKPSSSKIPAISSVANGSKAPVKPSSTGNTSGSSSSGTKPVAKSAADMSFFGTSSSSSTKPKGKLPDIKKRPTQPQLPPSAQAGSTSAVSNILQQLKAGPGNPVAPPTRASSSIQAGPGVSTEVKKEEDVKPRYNSKGKLIRNVRFKDDVKPEDGGGDLEQIKEFRQEAKEFERFDWEEEADLHGRSAHDLDIDEGAALASARGHSMIEWYEPSPYNEEIRLVETPESSAQASRERETLALFNPPGQPIPDPSELDVRIVEGINPQREMEPVNASEEILKFQSRGNYRPSQPQAGSSVLPQQELGDLLKGLSNIIPPAQVQPQQQQQGYGGGFGYDPYSTHNHGHENGNNQPTWAGYGNGSSQNHNYSHTRNYDNYDTYNQSRSSRPIDRDPKVPICRFWSRGE